MDRYLIIINGSGKHKFIKLFKKCKNSLDAYNIGLNYVSDSDMNIKYTQIITTKILNQKINKERKVLK